MDIFDKANCEIYAQPLRDACAQWGIVDVHDQARFLAQISVESAGFKKTTESMAYRPENLLRVLNGRNGVTTLAQAVVIVSTGQEAVAEALYGGSWGLKHLGNTQPGDGWKFIGHGLLQITGRFNHAAASKEIYGNDVLTETPELLTLAQGAAQSAAWGWMKRRLNGVTDVVAVTRAINGGAEGLERRQALTAALLSFATP